MEENEIKTANEKTKGRRLKKSENMQNNKKQKKILAVVFTILLIIIGIFAYLAIRPKFKDINVELGTTELNIDMFLVSKIYKSKAVAITDLSQIDLSQVGETEILLSFLGKEQTVKLKIEDTTAPQVKFQDLIKSLGYQINPEDFILEKSDFSEMQVELIDPPEITEYADYNIKIRVVDTYGNETIGECKLTITWLIQELVLELGTPFSKESIVLDIERFGDLVPQSEIDKVNPYQIGEYIIEVENEGKKYTSKIIVQDTIAPELELRNISIYDDERIEDYKQFISYVADASGEPTTILKTEINYTIIGVQDIIIEAVDINGNRTEKIAQLTIKTDTKAPTISGLTDLYVNKYTNIDYYSGVRANDDRDGNCEFTVNANDVNVGVAGTYYATYTSKDKKGNTTTQKRKIIVNHDQEDTNAKFNEFYNIYLAGKDIVSMAGTIRTQIKYNTNWGGDDPVWYGLTEGKGNCYVHASIMQMALNKLGYQNQLIWRTDKGHYWNLVKINGVWRHIDATPSVRHTLGLLTDEEKWNDAGLDGVGWDRSLWPSAE